MTKITHNSDDNYNNYNDQLIFFEAVFIFNHVNFTMKLIFKLRHLMYDF